MTKMPRQVFVHAHIPKSGGTTFRSILKRHFGGNHISEGGLIAFQYDSEQIKRGVLEHPKLRAYSAHHASLDLPYEMEDVVITGISFVRDPVAHIISHYFTHRYLSPKSTVPEIRTMNFQEYLNKSLLKCKQQAYFDGQVKFLFGRKIISVQKDFIKNGEIDEFSLGKLVELIKERKALVFPLSRFDEVCIVLERIFPKEFKDCSYSKAKNVSSRDQIVTEEDKELIAKHIGKLEYQLLEATNTLLDELIEDTFEDQAQYEMVMKKFNQRCRVTQFREMVFGFTYSSTLNFNKYFYSEENKTND